MKLSHSHFLLPYILILFSCATNSGTESSTDSTPDFELLKYNNPDAVVDLGVGLWATPIPMDYDNDGDMDLLVSCPDVPFNGIYFFENKSGETFPAFEAPVRLTSAQRHIQVSYVEGKPRVLVPGTEFVDFAQSLETKPQEIFPADSFINKLGWKPRFNQWKLVDFEGDGDEDIVVGVDSWGDYGWDNAYDEKGNWKNGPLHGYLYLIENVDGKYHERGHIHARGKPIDVYGAPSPNFADFDNDGDLDIVCGEFLDRFTWFENVGSREKPVFAEGRFLENADGVLKMDLEMIMPVAVDWNKDGFVDLVVGDEDGRVALVENTGKKVNRMPLFKSPVYFKQKADNVKFGALATPVGVDWDSDGDDDIISGNSAGYIAFIENLGLSNGSPKWAPPKLLKSNGNTIRIQAGSNGSIQGPAESKWGYTTLSVADWDHDGLVDLVINSIWGKVVWYKNIGSGSLATPQPVAIDWGTAEIPKPEGTWWEPEKNTIAAPWRTTPVVYDWNRDGLNDLVMLDTEGYLCLFERFKKENELWLKPGKRIFYGANASVFDSRHAVRDSVPGLLRLNERKFGGSGRRKICITDWNDDGKPDFLVNSVNVSVLLNKGEVDGFTHLENIGPVSDLRLAGHTTSPTMGDWDGDGVQELLVGAEDGHFYWLRKR